MFKQGFGKLFYYICLIIGLVLMALTMTKLKAIMAVEEPNILIHQQMYLLLVINFNFVLPIGIIVREILVTQYVKSKLIKKIILVFCLLIISLMLILFANTISFFRFSLYTSLFALIYSLMPAKYNETNKI